MKPNALVINLDRADFYMSQLVSVLDASQVLGTHQPTHPGVPYSEQFLRKLKHQFQYHVLDAWVDLHLHYNPAKFDITDYTAKFIRGDFLPPDVETHHYNLNYLNLQAAGKPVPPIHTPIRTDYVAWVQQLCQWYGVKEITDNPRADILEHIHQVVFYEPLLDLSAFVSEDAWRVYERQYRLNSFILRRTPDDFRIMHFMQHHLDEFSK